MFWSYCEINRPMKKYCLCYDINRIFLCLRGRASSLLVFGARCKHLALNSVATVLTWMGMTLVYIFHFITTMFVNYNGCFLLIYCWNRWLLHLCDNCLVLCACYYSRVDAYAHVNLCALTSETAHRYVDISINKRRKCIKPVSAISNTLLLSQDTTGHVFYEWICRHRPIQAA